MAASRAADLRCAAAASPFRVRKQDGSLAQQIRRAAVAAEAEDLEEMRRGLRSDVQGARRLLEEQERAEARRQEEQAELRDCVTRCRDEAAEASADAQEHWRRFRAAQEAIVQGYREGDRELGVELLAKMSELNAKLGENMAALEVEVAENVRVQIKSLHEELERRARPDLAQELETKCSSLLKEAEASLGTCLAEAAEASRKALRTARKEHEAFVLRRQKQLNSCMQECQEQMREAHAHCDGLAAQALAKVEALQEQEQRKWSGQLDSRLGRCEGECQALLSDARQHLNASEEMLQTWRRDGEALQQDQRASVADLRDRLEKVGEAAATNEKELRSQRSLLDQLAANFQTLQDRLVVVEAAASKQSNSLLSLRQKLQSVKESSSTQQKELQQQLAAEVAELRRLQAECEASQVAAMEEKQQALRRHCRAWSTEAVENCQEKLSARLQEVAKCSDAAAAQTQAQCRDWVDTALARLETLAVRTREQLCAYAEELPFTVRRLLAEELARERPKVATKVRRPTRLSDAVARDVPPPRPFELGEPVALPPAQEPGTPGEVAPSPCPVVQQVVPPPRGHRVGTSPPKTPSVKDPGGAPECDHSELHDLSFSPHAAG